MSLIYSDMNMSIFGGRLVAEPEFHEKNEKHAAFTKVIIASNKRWKSKDSQERKSKPIFMTVYFNSPNAEYIAKFHKGDALVAIGELRANEWTDKEGKKRYDLELLANDFQVPFSNKAESNHEELDSVTEAQAQ